MKIKTPMGTYRFSQAELMNVECRVDKRSASTKHGGWWMRRKRLIHPTHHII
jgi:hypothetical protein